MPAPAASTTDTGNNGTVKIHEGSTETEPIVHNEPHVCTFHLHFFFADPFQAGTWEIQEWSPGDKGTVVLSGTYDTNGDGEDRDPDAGAYELPDGHYKLFWDGDLDTEKHDKMKVFWVDCEAATEAPTFEQSQGGDTEAPTEVPTFQQSQAGETEAPTGTPVLETSGPSFFQTQGGVTDVPGGGVSQPPTDTLAPATPDSGGSRWMLIAMAILLATVLLTTPTAAMGASRIRRR
jgi:hypothetical protein